MHNELAWIQQCWKSCANRSNIVALRFGDHGTKEMSGVVGWKVWPVSNLAQQQATTSNNMQQGVKTDATCNIQQCCVRFPRGLKHNCELRLWNFLRLLLQKTAIKSNSSIDILQKFSELQLSSVLINPWISWPFKPYKVVQCLCSLRIWWILRYSRF